MTEEELKQLARDIHGGNVFTDRHIRPDDRMQMLSMVFMPLVMMDEENIQVVQKRLGDHGMMYEYMDKAGPRSVNGLPSFFSFHTVGSDDADKVVGYLETLEAASDAL